MTTHNIRRIHHRSQFLKETAAFLDSLFNLSKKKNRSSTTWSRHAYYFRRPQPTSTNKTLSPCRSCSLSAVPDHYHWCLVLAESNQAEATLPTQPARRITVSSYIPIFVGYLATCWPYEVFVLCGYPPTNQPTNPAWMIVPISVCLVVNIAKV